MNRLDEMTPRELLMVLTAMGVHATRANVSAPHHTAAKGPRGIRRRAKRRRARELERRLRRNSWRAYHAEERRRAGASS